MEGRGEEKKDVSVSAFDRSSFVAVVCPLILR